MPRAKAAKTSLPFKPVGPPRVAMCREARSTCGGEAPGYHPRRQQPLKRAREKERQQCAKCGWHRGAEPADFHAGRARAIH